MTEGNPSPIPILTIDGPSGVGKGTVAKLIAQQLGWHYLDSGALYRILAYAAKKSGVSLDSATDLATLADVIDIAFGDDGAMLGGAVIESKIRSETMGNNASIVAQHPEVRKVLLAKQKQFAQEPGLVADGRDMGTTVFPQADRKIFMTATVEERAKRRSQQLSRMGLGGSIAALCREIAARDERDVNRAESPLRPAEDAIVLDTTPLSIEQAVEAVTNSLEKYTDSDASG